MTWKWEPVRGVLLHSIGGVWGGLPGTDQEEVRVIRVTELKPFGALDVTTAAHRSISSKQLAGRRLAAGDLLLEKSGGGPTTPVGRVGLVPATPAQSVCSNFMQLLRPNPLAILPRFLHLYLNHIHSIGETVGMQTASTNIRNIKASAYLEVLVPVPPLDEQRRLVSILEEHLSELEAAETYLQHALRLATALVSKQLSVSRLGGLVPLAEIAEIQGGIQKQQKRLPLDNAYPFLRVANVTAMGLDLADVHRVELFGAELERLRLRRGDLLVVEGNGSPSQIGRAALWDGSIEDCVHQNHLIRVRANETVILPGYLEAVWNSPENRADLTKVSSSSSGLHTLSVSKLGRVLIPVPELSVQIDVLRKLDVVRVAQLRLLNALGSARSRGSALRRALLGAAFAGQLTSDISDSAVIEELPEEKTA